MDFKNVTFTGHYTIESTSYGYESEAIDPRTNFDGKQIMWREESDIPNRGGGMIEGVVSIITIPKANPDDKDFSPTTITVQLHNGMEIIFHKIGEE